MGRVPSAGDPVNKTFCSGYPTGLATATTSGGSVTVALSPTDARTGCPPTVLRNGTYYVYFFNGRCWTISAGQYSRADCVGAPTWIIGTLELRGGQGQGTFVLPGNLTPNGANEASRISVWTPPDPRGISDINETPIVVTA